MALSPKNIGQVAFDVGFRSNSLVIAIAISLAESSGIPNDDNGIAAGLWQINYHAHPQYDRTKLYQPFYNGKAAYTISNGGRDWGAWTTFDPSPLHPLNNSAYRKFLPVARTAAAKVDTNAPIGTTGGPAPNGQVGGIVGTLPPDNEPAIEVTIGGQLATSDLGYALVAADVQFTNTEASQLSLTFDDNDYLILRRYKLEAGPTGTPIEYAGTRWRIQTLATQPSDKGPQTQVTCQQSGVMRMRGFTPSSAKDISATEYMATIAKAAGLDFVGEPLSSSTDVGPQRVTDPVTGQKRFENAWEVGQRLAANHDLVAYESGGTYFFATPTFIFDQAKLWQLSVAGFGLGFGDPKAQQKFGEIIPALSWPTIAATKIVTPAPVGGGVTAAPRPQRTLSCEVVRGQGKRLRAGDAITVSGVPVLGDGTIAMAVTSVQWDPTDIAAGPVTIQAADLTMWASKAKQGGGNSSGSNGGPSGSGQGGIAKKGTAMAADFVTFALNQIGDRYVWGAGRNLSDKNPAAFDCSGLVYWAAGQTGIILPGTSQSQWTFCQQHGTSITVAKASRTRGALLFEAGSDGTADAPGHVAISLGDDKHTIEARGTAYGVNKQPISTGRAWSHAALVPGMNYGSGHSSPKGQSGFGGHYPRRPV